MTCSDFVLSLIGEECAIDIQKKLESGEYLTDAKLANGKNLYVFIMDNHCGLVGSLEETTFSTMEVIAGKLIERNISYNDKYKLVEVDRQKFEKFCVDISEEKE